MSGTLPMRRGERLLGVFCWLNKSTHTRNQAHSGHHMCLEISTALFPLSADWSPPGPPGQYQWLVVCKLYLAKRAVSRNQDYVYICSSPCWNSDSNYRIHQVCHKLCLGLVCLVSSSCNDFLCVKHTNLNLKIKISEAGLLARQWPLHWLLCL